MAKKSSFGDLSPEDRADLGRRIRTLVQAVGTQAEAARVAGLTTRQLSRMLSGEAAPSLLPIARLAAAAGLSLDWVVGGSRTAERIDTELLARVVDGIARVYREEGVRLSDLDLGRIAGEEYDVIVTVVTEPSERLASLRVALERVRRALREPEDGAQSRIVRRRA